jgi:hypothetical protein
MMLRNNAGNGHGRCRLPEIRRCGTMYCLALAVVASAINPVAAHHSFTAEYDIDAPATMRGRITKVEWTNPHVFFYLDARNADASVTSWALEFGAPNALYRRGWRRDSVKVGDLVTVEVVPARNNSRKAFLRLITLPDGHRYGQLPDGTVLTPAQNAPQVRP